LPATGDKIQLERCVELVDVAIGEKTGDYYVENSFFWGGFIAAVTMSDADKSLSEGFAKTVCDEIFDVDLKKARWESGA